jgi:hypothetical protein
MQSNPKQYMLMNEKQFYTSPEVDVLVVRFEENIMSNPAKLMLLSDWGLDNAAGASIIEDDGYDL